ncbi:MAG: L(+)-tartrate dehydratase subunit alpha [Anaerolineales bacterium]|nr:L(+)-tartrate dehydratase subunit alpha [Anaerolineales bacterium]
MEDLTEHFLELVRRAATDLSPNVENAIREARDREDPDTPAPAVLDTILENVELARKNSTPICQDTGTPIFYVHYPAGWSTIALRQQIRDAVATATEKAYLRPNAVDSLTGKNSGNNLGEDFPSVHFHEWEEDYVKADLLLKGGGCENVGAQYKLPNAELNAGRDLDGVRKVVLDTVLDAQGKGCAPGVLGVAVGGDRGSGYIRSKEQLFREIGERNPDSEVAGLEERIYEEANELGVGPMGLGGKTTVLDVQLDAVHRLPASFFVSVSYMCWAHRRRTLTYRDGEVQID